MTGKILISPLRTAPFAVKFVRKVAMLLNINYQLTLRL